MSEQVIGETMTILFALTVLAFIFFFCGLGPIDGGWWAGQAKDLGLANPTYYDNAIKFGRATVFVFLNAARESVM